jgi:protein-disulfide isomerase
MRLFSTLLTAVAILVPAFAAETASKKSALDKASFEAYIRQVELLLPNIAVKVGDPKPTLFEGFLEVPVDIVTPQGVLPLHYFVSKDGKLILKGSLYDIGKSPFQTELGKLKTDLEPSFGTPGAPVVLVIFSDFECPKCQEEAKIVRENLVKTFPDQVRVYFKNFPLEQIHPWAKSAAIAGRCVFREKPAAFWSYHDWMYEHQAEITTDNLKTKVAGWAETNNVDTAKLGQCMDTKATEAEVNRDIAEGRSLMIGGTPTMFINGRALTGALPWATLEQIIKMELGYQQTAATAGEKCCEVTIPSLIPGKK